MKTELYRVLELLKKHGSNATSFQITKKQFQYYFDEDGCIGYVDTGKAWVVAGEPVCASQQQIPLAIKFIQTAQKSGKRVVFFGVKNSFTNNKFFTKIPIGDEAFLNAQNWSQEVKNNKSFHEQVKRAQAKNVSVHKIDVQEFDDPKSNLKYKCEQLINLWLAAKPIAPMAFMVSFDPFIFSKESHFFLATQKNEIVGLLIAVPIYTQNGCFFEHIIRSPFAPNGTSELLIHTAIQEVKERKQNYVSLGLTPFYNEVPPYFQIIRTFTRGLYDFQGLRFFKQKIPTIQFQPLYIVTPQQQGFWVTLKDIAQAFVPQGWISFLFRTLFRLPSPLIQFFIYGGLIWVILLTQMNTLLWFPSFKIKCAWVVFDLFMIYGLWKIQYKIQKNILYFLAVGGTLDTFLTLVQITFFNRFYIYKWWYFVVFSLGILAPAITSILLWVKIFNIKKLHSLKSKISLSDF